MIDIFDTGYFFADGGAMFGAVPKTAWSRRYKSDGLNGCILAMRSVLLQLPGRLVLIDTGAGNFHPSRMPYYRFFSCRPLQQCLADKGFSPEDITDVVLTHLHFDHCGGCVIHHEDGRAAMAFPLARYWVSRSQWNNFLNPHPLESGSFFIDDMKAVEESGMLNLIDDDISIAPGLTLRIADGHTTGQILPYILSEDETVVFAGDVIPLFASISPEWISAYDIAPLQSYDSKICLLNEAATNNQRIIFCHDAYTVSSKIRKTSGGLFVADRKSVVNAGIIPQILPED